MYTDAILSLYSLATSQRKQYKQNLHALLPHLYEVLLGMVLGDAHIRTHPGSSCTDLFYVQSSARKSHLLEHFYYKLNFPMASG